MNMMIHKKLVPVTFYGFILSLLIGCTPSLAPEPTLKPQSQPALAPPQIEVGNQSGVAGYHAAVFGSGFGESAGSVTILGETATLITWSDTFVEVTVPTASAGEGDFLLTTADEQTATHPFTVYTIHPDFQQSTDTFTNIAFNKPAHLSGLESEFCFAQPENTALEAKFFLTNYTCGFQGVNNVGDATFGADSSLEKSSTIAINLETDLAGELWFQFFGDSNWYPDPPQPVPVNYQLQVSADSTDGEDGTWFTLQTVSDNDRASRTHRVTVPSDGYQWMRLLVTDGSSDSNEEAGNNFKLREIRVYQPAAAVTRPDTFALYGDSLVADAFDAINVSGFAHAVQTKRDAPHDLLFSTYGLVGQNSTGFLDGDGPFDMYDAFALDDMQANGRFWGIGIGTNDSADAGNTAQYGERLDAVVAQIIQNGGVPIVARIPDTDESRGGFGDLTTKKKILADIDRIAAQYRLIPGPDLYTRFRHNLETDGGSWLSDDGTHHTAAGEAVLIDMWADAFVTGSQATPQQGAATPTPAATVTATAIATVTVTITATVTPTQTPIVVPGSRRLLLFPSNFR